MTKNAVILLLASIFCAQFHPMQFAITLPTNLVAGAKFVQGILNFCTNMHKTSTDEMIKTFRTEDDNKNAKCAMMCVLQSAQVINKDGSLALTDIENVLAQLPTGNKKTILQDNLHQCVEQSNSIADGCEKAFRFTKCIAKVKDEIPIEAIKAMMSFYFQ